MNKKKTKKVIRNYVAKYMTEVLRPAVELDKKKLEKLGKTKHKKDLRRSEE